ncbi:SIR2 family protein [Bacillus sp. 166amftsu]|uniref:SIR2 family protein n=1 Tax=Bacillus sp. 166amftsu TaxID=1761753 RepID=UPI00089D8134|nr:SIR2 family protein [Bacillus sp. 166amftsu]SDZ43158.1 SIR2-like domain-containing protein [Bacillus sp. 166amftsu]
MDNQLMSLSFSMEANKGVYALLLGSGISYSADIPTGWGILKELCRRIMELNGETHEDSIQWYQNYYGQSPAYDEVIEMLAKTSTERVGLLAEFFEPKEGDEAYVKRPTKAHKEIAKLVNDGYIKVIVTTNFDRLMEQALDELDIQYQTLYHESDIAGMKPLTHANCTVLKIHGDYRDTRFKNVSNELQEYPPVLSNLLKQIFDEYGIITSGWSAEWDTALRDTIKSVKGRRYSWYWHAYNETLSEQAEALLKWRDGIKIVNGNGADSFFSLLSENVESISKLKKSSPENIQMKINKLKKFITNDLEIELYEMITEETQMLVQFIKSLDFNVSATSVIMKEYVEKIKEKSRTLSIMLTILTYYSRNKKHESIITETLERLTTAMAQEGITTFICLSKLPAIIGLYSAGIAAVMKKNYKLLNKLFTEIRVRTNLYRPETFLGFTGSSGDIYIAFRSLYEERLHLPFETKFMQPYMCDIYANSKLTFDEQELNDHYDIFELLLTLKHRHLKINRLFSGMFGFKYDKLYIEHFLKSGAEEKENWQVLELFDNSIESFTNSLEILTGDLNSEAYFDGHQLLSAYQTGMKSEGV